MKRIFAFAVSTLLVLIGTSPSYAAENDKDCTDFASQEEAQKYWNEKGYTAENDPERLDRDGDGVPCESNGTGGGDTDDTSNDKGTKENGNGGPMPDTTIPAPLMIGIGSGLSAVGALLLLVRRKLNA